MAWRWLGDKPLSGPTSDNYWYHFTNSDLLYIWCPRVDAISLITLRPPHSKGNHSPHGLYTHSSEILNFGVKLITGLCQFIWTVTPGGLRQYRESLYWQDSIFILNRVPIIKCSGSNSMFLLPTVLHKSLQHTSRRMLTHDTVQNAAS